ncbi:heptaprenyl diphosphate synthase [Thermosyntropha lipolytica DSM 11003]|uniref:Heptaprenyl diphosphate synthase n=1 Tax=Thermosyntropha lipolytica DSM 11003 TaxID=1123382 RepID=A0A1M5NJX6_9FIRM|nr:polyprenyl synthetase family protein [Thermosyntropha lipolytica]SHG89821.1 heptaprenyl diphosphate synthase [Thermosyntropha lipolytica DSM 11003]
MGFDFFKPIEEELKIVEKSLGENINTDIRILDEAAGHLISAGGKRLRPAFALLSAKVFRDDLEYILPMATALELVHMATLVHDDVIDNSEMRRGTFTVKSGWGNRISIYAGNYIFARALALAASYGRSDILNILADASMKICEGEIVQLLSAYDVTKGLKNYLRRIERKTALLIAVSCELGAALCNVHARQIEALRLYGHYLGMAFQITDDILDLVADEKVLGKPTGSDIRQGVITLPVLFALKHSPRKDELRKLLSSPELCSRYVDYIIDKVLDAGGVDYAYEVSTRFARKAKKQLSYLPDVAVKQNLHDIADFIIKRDY